MAGNVWWERRKTAGSWVVSYPQEGRPGALIRRKDRGEAEQILCFCQELDPSLTKQDLKFWCQIYVNEELAKKGRKLSCRAVAAVPSLPSPGLCGATKMHEEGHWAFASMEDLSSARCSCKADARALEDVVFRKQAAKLLSSACKVSKMPLSDLEASFKCLSPGVLRSVVQVLSTKCGLEERKRAVAALDTGATPVPPVLISVLAHKLEDPMDTTSSVRREAGAGA